MVTTIWMITGIGKWFPSTDAFGFRAAWQPAGHLITSVIGCGSRPGVGHGLAMSPGLCSISLRALGIRRRLLGMGARAARCASRICSGACRVCGRQWIWSDGGIRRRLDGSCLVSARPARCVGAGLSLQPAIHSERERYEYADGYVAQVTNVYNNYSANRTVNVNEYTYARNVSAVTVVARETFVNARPVANATIRITPEQFESARVVENAPLAPTRNSYVASTAKPVPASKRPAKSFTDRKVVAKLPPPIPPSGGHEAGIVDSTKPQPSRSHSIARRSKATPIES